MPASVKDEPSWANPGTCYMRARVPDDELVHVVKYAVFGIRAKYTSYWLACSDMQLLVEGRYTWTMGRTEAVTCLICLGTDA